MANDQLTGTQKAAVVLMQLDPQAAADVMKQLTEEEAEGLVAEIVRLRKIDAAIAERAIDEFHQLSAAVQTPRGGSDVADALLRTAYGDERAQDLMERIAGSADGAVFESIESIGAGELAVLLSGELPQTIAIVLANIDPERASTVLGELSSAERAAVARAIASLGEPRPEAVSVIAQVLRERSNLPGSTSTKTELGGGIDPLVEIMNLSSSATEKALLADLAEVDPLLGEQVRSRLIGFADIVRFEDRDIQQALRGIELGVLAAALSGVSAEIDQKVRQNLSEKNRELLDDEIQVLGKVKESQIDEAREPLIRALRDLARAGALPDAEQEHQEGFAEVRADAESDTVDA